MDEFHNFYNRIQKSGNYLLVKDDIGKAKPPVRKLPGADFAYGKKVEPDEIGAGGLLSSWQLPVASKLSVPDKDFKKLNALSLKKGCINPKMQTQFRSANNIRLNTALPKRRQDVPDIVFGEPTRPSTPIQAVLGNFYGMIADEANHRRYEPAPVVKMSVNPRATKGSEMMKSAIKAGMEQPARTEFKMKKYQNTKPRTETRRVNK